MALGMELVLVTGNGTGMTVVMGHWNGALVAGCWTPGAESCTLGRTLGSKLLVAPWLHPGGLGGAWAGAASPHFLSRLQWGFWPSLAQVLARGWVEGPCLTAFLSLPLHPNGF